MNKNNLPETLQEAVIYFANAENAFDIVKQMRWPDGRVTCPRCDSDTTYFLADYRLWKCGDCKKQFSLKVGTIMEDSPIGLDKWLCAFWLIVNAKNGISSYEIMRALGVTQKTGWFMLHRIRLAMQNGSLMGFKNKVEVDETFIGGKARNMHKGKRRAQGSGTVAMTPVMGFLQRGTSSKPSRVMLKVTKGRSKAELQGLVRSIVDKGSEVFTDEFSSYQGLERDYVHQVIDHLECYAKGKIHTNGLENFWSLLKRGLKGTYVNVEPFHLFRYCDEQAFRFNNRKDDDQGRFLTAMRGMFGKGIRYKKLIGQAGDGDLLPPSGAWQAA